MNLTRGWCRSIHSRTRRPATNIEIDKIPYDFRHGSKMLDRSLLFRRPPLNRLGRDSPLSCGNRAKRNTSHSTSQGRLGITLLIWLELRRAAVPASRTVSGRKFMFEVSLSTAIQRDNQSTRSRRSYERERS